ncbi:MAG: hypothetical protein BWX51_00049 [Bacteroidetes bacterium ADurb.Bin012]|nr:MAG: hypothetical protein BWX51_00049 [Bacteroidetes bacterium ADurb.Bin012]
MLFIPQNIVILYKSRPTAITCTFRLKVKHEVDQLRYAFKAKLVRTYTLAAVLILSYSYSSTYSWVIILSIRKTFCMIIRIDRGSLECIRFWLFRFISFEDGQI